MSAQSPESPLLDFELVLRGARVFVTGHTGFTGTSVWLDPESRTFVVLLTNAVHPYRRPAISSLRSKVATVVAASVGVSPHATAPSAVERSVGTHHSGSAGAGPWPLPRGNRLYGPPKLGPQQLSH